MCKKLPSKFPGGLKHTGYISPVSGMVWDCQPLCPLLRKSDSGESESTEVQQLLRAGHELFAGRSVWENLAWSVAIMFVVGVSWHTAAWMGLWIAQLSIVNRTLSRITLQSVCSSTVMIIHMILFLRDPGSKGPHEPL